jgi:hypothetical protein
VEYLSLAIFTRTPLQDKDFQDLSFARYTRSGRFITSLLNIIVDKRVLKKRNVCSEVVPHVVLYDIGEHTFLLFKTLLSTILFSREAINLPLLVYLANDKSWKSLSCKGVLVNLARDKYSTSSSNTLLSLF